jgi:hypothetical protein
MHADWLMRRFQCLSQAMSEPDFGRAHTAETGRHNADVVEVEHFCGQINEPEEEPT